MARCYVWSIIYIDQRPGHSENWSEVFIVFQNMAMEETMEKIKCSEKVTNEVPELIGDTNILLNISYVESQLSFTYSKKKSPSS